MLSLFAGHPGAVFECQLPGYLALLQGARQAGWRPIPGVRYRKHRWSITPRMAWLAATEQAATCAELALSLRQLDPMLQVGRLGGDGRQWF
jgi:hypothetical protein